MGAGLSRFSAGQSPEIRYDWLLEYAESAIKYANSVSLEAFTSDGKKYMALAYQASESPYECSIGQNLRFALSKDGGDTWTPSRVLVWGLSPLWCPVLFFHDPSSRLFMFYSESRKAYSPGGDIKLIFTEDLGTTWSPPITIYTHEADGEVPKVATHRPAIDDQGRWHLAFHSEPLESFKTFNSETWSPLKESEDAIPKSHAPPTATPQGLTTVAGVLTSTDAGATWTVSGRVEDPKTWLIDPSLEWSTKKKSLLMLFRTGVGRIFSSRSTDGGATWTRASATTLPNPNSKFATITIDEQILIAYNPSTKEQSSLALALSVDDGRSWEALAMIDRTTADSSFSLTSPAIAQWSDDTVKVAYTVWGRGIKLATIKLPIVDT